MGNALVDSQIEHSYKIKIKTYDLAAYSIWTKHFHHYQSLAMQLDEGICLRSSARWSFSPERGYVVPEVSQKHSKADNSHMSRLFQQFVTGTPVKNVFTYLIVHVEWWAVYNELYYVSIYYCF